MIERRAPTHVLTVEVPVNLAEPRNVDPVQTAVSVCLAVSRAAFDGLICDDPQVTLREVEA